VNATSSAGVAPADAVRSRLPAWWPLAGLLVLAAALRFSTLGLQSFWYDESFSPVHVLHGSLWATLRSVVHTENTPPLWYVIAWADARVLGTSEVALRLPSALAGVATVPVAWAIGRELAGRRAAIVAAALVAVNPLFVWYSQEARAYALFMLLAAATMLCFLRAEREPTPARMAAFALSGSLALLTHYFAVFLLIPMVVWLARPTRTPGTRRTALAASGAVAIVGLALLPLISTQGGRGTQWIGQWSLSSRLQAIPQYYLTGYSGAPLGHSVELLVALPILAGLGLGLWRMLDRSTGPPPQRALRDAADPALRAARPATHEERGALIALAIAAGGILIPIVLAVFGADYLAPRNLVAAMIPVTAVIAVVVVSGRTGRAGMALAAMIAVAFLVISIDVELSPRLQRGNWRGVARVLRGAARENAITSVELGTAPLEYYLPVHSLARRASVTVREIDETGYAPLRRSAGRPPAPGFRLLDRLDINGLIVYRFVSPVPRTVSQATLRRQVITLTHPFGAHAHPEVLVPVHAQVSLARAQMSSSIKKI
jgi:mannosyltransferase